MHEIAHDSSQPRNSEFLASLNDAPYMTQEDQAAVPSVAQPPSSNHIGGLPINDTSSSQVNHEPSSAKEKGKEREKITTSTGNSAGHSVPGSPINK